MNASTFLKILMYIFNELFNVVLNIKKYCTYIYLHSFIIHIAINLNKTPTKMNRTNCTIFHFKILTAISDKT